VTQAENENITCFIVNRSLTQPAEITVNLRDFGSFNAARHLELHHDNLNAINTEAAPNTVAPVEKEITPPTQGALTFHLQPASWNVIRLIR